MAQIITPLPPYHPGPLRRFEGVNPVAEGNLRPDSDAHLAAARAAAAAGRAAWPQVQQPHPEDREYLKAILREKRLSRIPEAEPATVGRLRQLLRRAGISQRTAEEAVGMALQRLIEANPGVALWWLAATTVETVA